MEEELTVEEFEFEEISQQLVAQGGFNEKKLKCALPYLLHIPYRNRCALLY